MRRPKAVIVATVIVVLVLGFAALGVMYVRDRMSSRLTVINRSGQMITTFTIQVWGDTYIRSELEDGQSVRVPIIRRNSDSSYHVFGTFANGTTFDDRFGYVTGQYAGERATIAVYPGGRIEGKQP